MSMTSLNPHYNLRESIIGQRDAASFTSVGTVGSACCVHLQPGDGARGSPLARSPSDQPWRGQGPSFPSTVWKTRLPLQISPNPTCSLKPNSRPPVLGGPLSPALPWIPIMWVMCTDLPVNDLLSYHTSCNPLC